MQQCNVECLHYIFYVEGNPNPIIIESFKKSAAISQLATKTNLPIINLKVYRPVYGVTKKIINNIVFVWAGKNKMWIPEQQFNATNP